MAGTGGELISRIESHLQKFKNRRYATLFPPVFINPKPVSRLTPQVKSSEKKQKSNATKLDYLFQYPYESHPRRDAVDADPLPEYEEPKCPLQKLLFSATLSTDPERLLNVSLYRPVLFTTSHDTAGECYQDF